MEKRVIITAALSGTATTKEMAPAVPLTAEEIAEDAVAVVKAGASVIHIHVRDERGLPTMDTGRFEETYHAVQSALKREGLDAVLNLTTSGASGGTAPLELRLGHLRRLKPEMCSFDAGTMNWDCSLVFENTPAFLTELCQCVSEEGVKPEIEIFDGGMMGNVEYYVKNGLLKSPCHYQFVLGVLGGLEGTVKNLLFLKERLPEGATWSVTGIGKAHVPMMLAGLALGCDGLRVGLEDNLYLSRGVKATNAQLVARAAGLCLLAGREPATAAQAREILSLPAREMV